MCCNDVDDGVKNRAVVASADECDAVQSPCNEELEGGGDSVGNCCTQITGLFDAGRDRSADDGIVTPGGTSVIRQQNDVSHDTDTVSEPPPFSSTAGYSINAQELRVGECSNGPPVPVGQLGWGRIRVWLHL